MARTLLFVDDETFFAQPYIDALRDAGFAITHKERASDALDYLTSQASNVDLLILDIMLPTPTGVPASATGDGLETGVWLLHQSQAAILDAQIPVLVLTNSRKKTIEAVIRDRVPFPEGRLDVCSKSDVRARELPGRVAQLLRTRSRAND
jgi:CheY-like chemotaxis protein